VGASVKGRRGVKVMRPLDHDFISEHELQLLTAQYSKEILMSRSRGDASGRLDESESRNHDDDNVQASVRV
jgi:hypothetical protein